MESVKTDERGKIMERGMNIMGVLLVLCVALSESAFALYVDVYPENPTITDSVSIEAWTWFPYAERYNLVSATYSIADYTIDMEVIMEDDWYGLTIPAMEGGLVEVGILAEGYYSVNADMYMVPFGGSIPELYESGSTSFKVVPEPATVFLLAIGIVGIRAKHRNKARQYIDTDNWKGLQSVTGKESAMLKRTALLSAIVCLTIYSSAAFASDLGYEPGVLLVRFSPKPDGKQRTIAERNELLTSIGEGTVKRCSKFVPGLTLVKLPANTTVENSLSSFKNIDGILYVEPNYRVKALSMFPDDTYFQQQWGMHNTGQTGGTKDADIDAPEVWDIIKKSQKKIKIKGTDSRLCASY